MPNRAAQPHSSGNSALLIIDMINRFDFDGGVALARAAQPVAERIAALKRRYHRAGAPVIYANDNFMDWRADFNELVALCSRSGERGADIARLLAPGPTDYFILKPKHSAFLATPLPLLLSQLEARRLVITGIAADSCILVSAQDAKMREFSVVVPPDCVAAQTAKRLEHALAVLKGSLVADLCQSTAISP